MDKIVLCYDSMDVDYGINDSRNGDIISLNRQIQNIVKVCKGKNIQLSISDYTCFEELILCYKNLLWLVQYKQSDNFNKEYEFLASWICNSINKCNSLQERSEIYKNVRDYIIKISGNKIGIKTTEAIIGLILKNITGNSNYYFKNWCINKKDMGVCWKDINCNSNKCLLDSNKCNSCNKNVIKQFNFDWLQMWNDIIRNSKGIHKLYNQIIK